MVFEMCCCWKRKMKPMTGVRGEGGREDPCSGEAVLRKDSSPCAARDYYNHYCYYN